MKLQRLRGCNVLPRLRALEEVSQYVAVAPLLLSVYGDYGGHPTAALASAATRRALLSHSVDPPAPAEFR